MSGRKGFLKNFEKSPPGNEKKVPPEKKGGAVVFLKKGVG